MSAGVNASGTVIRSKVQVISGLIPSLALQVRYISIWVYSQPENKYSKIIIQFVLVQFTTYAHSTKK